MSTDIATVAVSDEEDVVYARQRGRLIAELLGFERTDQTRISTAVSEIARNAYQYGGGGEVAFALEGASSPQLLTVTVRDQGPGIKALEAVLEGSFTSPTGMGLGIVGTRRLMDQFSIESAAGAGTTVCFGKTIPAAAPRVTADALRHLADMLAKTAADSPLAEVRVQNQELLHALEELQQRELELVRLNQRLADANRELEAFAYSVSHDLRAPLRALDGFSHILLEDYGALLDDKGRSYLDRILVADMRMAALIDGLLELSRLNRDEVARERLDISEMARGVAAELAEAEPGRAVEFAIADGLEAHGDRRLIGALLANLLGNAWKYTAKHETTRIEVGVDDSDGERAFYVRDDGAGFDMAYADKLFGAFERLHSQDEFEGLGIGLATVQRIVRRHGGHVWAESEIEKGATFYFRLPAASGT